MITRPWTRALPALLLCASAWGPGPADEERPALGGLAPLLENPSITRVVLEPRRPALPEGWAERCGRAAGVRGWSLEIRYDPEHPASRGARASGHRTVERPGDPRLYDLARTDDRLALARGLAFRVGDRADLENLVGASSSSWLTLEVEESGPRVRKLALRRHVSRFPGYVETTWRCDLDAEGRVVGHELLATREVRQDDGG